MPPSNLEILAHEDTPLGQICLRRRELLSRPGTVVTEITLDGAFLMSSLHTESERALAGLALAMHPGSGLHALVGGLGLGYTAAEVLASDHVAELEVVELLPQVIDWLERDLVPLAPALKADPRLRVVQDDVYARLAGEPRRNWDLILIDVDHAPDDRLDTGPGAFYTEKGLRAASRHLAPDGVLAVWSYAPSSPFADALRTVFAEVRLEEVIFTVDMVDEVRTDWLFLARC
ncbi:MAG TPA: spermidine synthase [Planctomycetota bacterium]